MAKNKEKSISFDEYQQKYKSGSGTLSYDQYQKKYNKAGNSILSYDQYQEKQRQRAEQAQLEQQQARQQQIKDMAVQSTIQKARDMNNPFMNGSSRMELEMAGEVFGYGRQYTVENGRPKVIREANPQKREFVEWLMKLNKAKKDKEAGVTKKAPATPIVQRSPEEIKTEYATQKANQLREAIADRALGFGAVEDSRKKNNTGNNWTLGQQFDIYGDRRKYQAEGLYGDSGLPWYMNDEQRKALREESEKKAKDLRTLAEQYENIHPGESAAGLFDYVHGLDVNNEQSIINNPAYKGTESERNASLELERLNSTYNMNRQNVSDQAENLLNGSMKLEGESEYEKQKIREEVYNWIMPDTYKKRTKDMNYEQTKALNDEIDKAIAGMRTNWESGNQADEIAKLNREASAWEAQVNAIDEAQKFYDFMAGKRQFAADSWMGDVSSTYDPSLHPEPIATENERGIEIYEPQGNELEKAYYYANNWQNMGDQARALNVNKYMFLAADPEILEMFNKFYAKDKAMGSRGSFGTNLAEQFLKGLDPYLTSMMVEYQNNYIQSVSQDPLRGGMLRVMSPAFQAVGGVTGTLAAITGQDLDSGLYLPTRIATQTRARQNEDISELARQAFGDFGGDATEFMLGVVDSIADNVFAMGVGTALGGEGTKKAMRFVQAIMSGSATSNKMVEMLENGVQPTEAALYAVGDGVIEWLTERFSLEQIMGPDVKQLLGNKKALASFMARSAGAEGSEEISSSLLNLGLDYILSIVYGHEDKLKQKYNELITRYGMTDEEARKKVLMDQLRETGLEGLAGAMSGFAMAGSRVITNAAENRQAGRQVKKTNSSDLILDVAKGMTEGTESRNLAEQLAKEMEAGEEISDSDMGRLARLTELEAAEQYKNKSEDALKDSVMQEMEGKDLQGTDKEEATQVIVKAIKGGSESLSKAERAVLLKDTVLNIYKNYLGATEQTAKAIGAQLDATEAERKAQKSLAEIFKPAARTTNTGDNVVHGVTAEEIRLAEQVSEHIKAGTEVLLDGKFQKLDGVEVTKDKDGKYSLQAVVDGKAVPAAAIKATGSAVGRIVGEASINPEFFSKQFTETLLKAQEEGKIKDPERNLNEAKQIRMYAYMGFQMPATSLDYKLASQIYKDSAEEHGQNRKAQAAEGNRKEQGRITFDGAEHGTKEWNTKVKNLDSAARNQMDAIAGIAQRAGIEVDFTDLNDTTVYGSESRSGIRINVAGLNYGSISGEATSRHNMVVTFGHEMTHWLQRNSMRGYNRLEQFVMQQYRQTQGENELTRRLNHHMMQWGLSLEDAMSEIVADSCDQILANETVMQHIQETDKNLYTEVKGFVKNLVERIKQAVTGMSGSASRDARALAQSTNEIAKVWLGAYDEALTGVAAEKTDAVPAEAMRLSQAETDTAEDTQIKKQVNSHLEQLNKMDPVASIASDIDLSSYYTNGAKSENAAVKAWAAEMLKDGADREGFGHVEISSQSIKKGLGYISNIKEKAAFAAVKDVIEKGDEINYHKAHKGGQADSHTFAAKILMDGEPKLMAVVVRYSEDINRYKTHKLYMPDGTVVEMDKNNETELATMPTGKPADTHNSVSAGAVAGSKAIDAGNKEQAVTPSTSDIINDMASRVKLDQEYEDAAGRGDIKKTTEMLLKKLADTQGVIPFMAPEWDAGNARETAKLLKVADPEAIATAADKMSDYVPDNAVLIPMPGHEGKLTADSWSVKLAEAISERTGRPVVIALEGAERESRQKAKGEGRTGASQEELGFRQVEDLPAGTFPIFIDNIVGSGVTADAARQAIGGGITLAYAKSLRSPGMRGLKNLTVTHESIKNGGGLIPLSERLNVEKQDVRYSKAELDDQYMKAVESGNTEEQQRLVDQVAEAALADSKMRTPDGKLRKLYHGTSSDDFTVFDLGMIGSGSGDSGYFGRGFYFAYSKGEASYYGRNIKEVYLDIKNPFNYVNELHILNGERSFDYNASRAVFITNFADKFPELATEHTVSVWKKGEDTATELSLKEFADEYRKLINDKKFTVEKVERDGETEFIAYADKHKESFTDDDGTVHSWMEYGFQRRCYSEEEAKNQLTNAYEYMANNVYDYIKIQNPTVIIMETDFSNSVQKRGYDGIIQSEDGDEAVVFDSSQIKLADPVTYDDEGNVIPLSERFNAEESDIRWSRSEESYDVEAWLGNMTYSGLQTEDERILMETFKGLRVSMSLALHKQVMYQERIKELEKRTVLDADARHELETLKQKLQGQRWRMEQLEKEMAEVTSSEGYAGLMYKHNMLFKDFIAGKTQEQVSEKADQLMAQVKEANREIERQRAELKKLAQSQAVKTMQSFLGKTSLERMTDVIRKQYNSALSREEVRDRLAYMAIKLADGQDIKADAEALAWDLRDQMRGLRDDNLEYLRGTTFYIGESLAKQLKAENSSVGEQNEKLRGSGVRLVVNQRDKNGYVSDRDSHLVEQWNELRRNNQSLEEYGPNDIDVLHGIVDMISRTMEDARANSQAQVNMDEAATMVYASAASVTTYFVEDAEAKKQIRNLMSQIRELSDKTGDIAADMENLEAKLNESLLTALAVKGWSEALQNDMRSAINYYNKTAAVAAQTERTKVKEGLIKQLRSENTRKLIAQQEKYRQMMKDDREARETAQKIQGERYKINTNIRRLKNLLTAETDQKNVPEEAKPLARMMSKMLVLHDQSAMRKVLLADNKQLADFAERLDRMDKASGEFDPERDLDFLVIKAPNAEDNDYTLRDKVWHDLMDIESGLLEYRNAEGQGKVSLKDRAAALEKIQKAVSEISTVIKRRGEAFISGKRYEVAALAEQFENEAQASRFKGERRGRGSGVMDTIEKALKYGNLTPEYFIKNLRNGVISLLFDGFHDAEQESGLEARDAKERMAKIAEETGFANWDGQQKHTIIGSGGREITITTEQLMALYATWLREKNSMRPEATAHLLNGGFVLAESETNKGKPRREIIERRPVRMSAEQLDALGKELTDQQRAYVDAVIEYMSTDLAEIGNRASMDAYGIRKFTEKYYFPIKSWRGVMNQRSDRGVNNKNDNRAMRQSFTKRITAGAQNAIEISDFTPTAVKHVVGMITFNTVGPAVENLNKLLNQQLTFGEKARDEAGEVVEDSTYKTNMGAAFQEHYGKAAYDYLVQFMQDVNGGVTQRKETSLRENLLTLFKKSAVAGSLSVAAQQPLSYIRASMLVNPKYLAAALSPQYWKGSFAEMLQYSGVANIKQMGKFDMNYGRSMIDFITPEGLQDNKAKAAYEWVSEKSTKLPEIMDNMTWTRMWTAVKLEQAAKNPGVDMKSEAFLQQVAERFNELMRRTQVYDSVMVKSQNMRSTSYLKKVATSFMAEPTLSLNVLADAWQNIKTPGGKKQAAKALATFLLSAAAQAGAKAFFGAGRSPDKKKTRKENFLNKFGYNLLSEANPLGLIPGYSQLMNVLADGELKDDAMGVIGKAVESVDKIFNLATGQTKKGTYRDLEDSLGQLVQYATNIPAKNIMRDFRAMVNWFSNGSAGFTGDSYAQRETSGVVLKYQFIDTLLSEDLLGLLNDRLMDAGYDTDAKGYVQRLYDAQKTGNKKRAEDLNEYLTLAFGKKQEKINSDVNTLVKADESTSIEEKQKLLKENEYGSMSSWVLDQYREGSIDRKKAEKLYREERPTATDKQVLEALDKIDYEKRTGRKVENYSNYTPLYDAIEENRTEKIREALKYMMENGYKKEDIKKQLTTKYKQAYLDADVNEKWRIRNAIQIIYKAMGYTATDADKIINGWKSEKKK